MSILLKKTKQGIRIELFSVLADIFENGYLEKDEFIKVAEKTKVLIKIIKTIHRRDLYIILYDRLPERAWEINLSDTLNKTITFDLLYDFLYSEESKLVCDIVYAKTFIDRGVDIFIHINKTAGSSLNTLLGVNYDILNGKHDAASISSLYSNSENRNILLSGHRYLDFYESNFPLTQVRRIFTVVRDPIDLAISFFNFALTMADNDHPAWGLLYKDIVSTWRATSDKPINWFERYLESDFFAFNVKGIFYKFLGSKFDSPEDIRAIFNNLLRHGVIVIKPEQINTYFKNDEVLEEVRSNESIKYINRESLPFDAMYALTKRLTPEIEFYSMLNNFSEWENNGVLDFNLINTKQSDIKGN